MRLIDADVLEDILYDRLFRIAIKPERMYGNLAGAISGCLKLVRAQPTIEAKSTSEVDPVHDPHQSGGGRR